MKKVFTLLIAIAFILATGMQQAKAQATINVPADEPTIQDAIDVAVDGDIINVAAGTYDETLSITKSVHIIGAGAASTTITTTSSAEQMIFIGSGTSGLALPGGVTIEGFTLTSSTLTGDVDLIKLRASVPSLADPILIQNNIFNGVSGSAKGIETSGKCENFKILNNEFNECIYGMWFNVAINGEISGNTITDTKYTAIALNTSTTDALHDVDITDNIITGSSTAEPDYPGNAYLAGINLADVCYNITVTGNTIQDSHNWSLVIHERGIDALTGIVIEENSFLNNSTTYGTLNQITATTINVENNWWGDTSGPTHASNVGGTGDKVGDYFYYDPWCINSSCTVTYPVNVYTDNTLTTFVAGYATIQEAINAGTTLAEHVIVADAGTYPEADLLINKTLTLQGANADKTGADGSRGSESIIEGAVRVEADNVTVQGFFIDGTNVDQTPVLRKRGVLVANTNARADVTIKNNIIKNWATGISFAGGLSFPWVDGATIDGNLLINNGIGSTENVNDLTIDNNTFDNGGVGLGGGAVLAGPITGNDFSNGSRYIAAASGVTTDFSAMLSANTFDGAASAELITGQWYDRAIFSTIQGAVDMAGAGSTVKVAAGTYPEQVNVNKSVTIEGNNSGISAGAVPGSRNPESIVDGGFYVHIGSASTVIDGFTIQNGYNNGSHKTGVVVNTTDVEIKNNIIKDCSGSQSDAIEVVAASNNLLAKDNEIVNNWRGMFLNPSDGITLEGNAIHANNGVGVGIGSDGQSNLTLTGNKIYNHTLEGWGSSAVGANVAANFNSFTSNGVSVAHYGGSQIDATCNWWGDTDPSNDVSGDVNYTPYNIADGGACAGGLPAIVTTIETPTSTTCGTLDVDVTVQNFTSVANISLTLNYDEAVLEYQGVDLNSEIDDAVPNGTIPGLFILSRQVQTDEVTLDPDEVLFTLHFNILPAAVGGNTTDIKWDTFDPANNEYASGGSNPYIYPASFIDLEDYVIPVRPVVNTTTELEYCSIQAAIDDPLTIGGHTIEVAAGTYTENVNINKANLTIVSTTLHGAVIDGYVTIPGGSDGVTLDGFKINPPETATAIAVNTAGNVTITNNEIIRPSYVNKHGIVFSSSAPASGSTITNNIIKNCGLGIIVDHDGLSFTIAGNTLDGNRKAISVGSGTCADIQYNFITNSTDMGIEIFKADCGFATNNVITGNSVGISNSDAVNTYSATCNWWGTVDLPTIEGLLVGDVDAVPFLTGGDDEEPLTPGFQPEADCDEVLPDITCPADLTVSLDEDKDPYATGYATATDNSGTVTVTYSDDISALNSCNTTGDIVRTWTATDPSGNVATCEQTITVIDDIDPVIDVPANMTVNNDPGECAADVTYPAPTATDFGHFQGFEHADWVSGDITMPSTDWNSYQSPIVREASGLDGITSKTGAAHAVITEGSGSWTGVFSRLGGYSTVFGDGFITSVDVYLDLSDSKVGASEYGFDISTAANGQDGNHQRDFIFHAAGEPDKILIAGDNGSNFARRNDLGSLLNHYEVTASGWYTFQWNFKDAGDGSLAVDMNLLDASGTVLWTETRNSTLDVISTEVGGNRYMWFTFLSADKLAIDNTSLIRKLEVTASQASGDEFQKGVTTVELDATDACGNTAEESFTIEVVDVEDPEITTCAPAQSGVVSSGCSALMPDFTGDVVVTDNCGAGNVTITQVPAAGTSIAWTGSPETVTITAEDEAGNTVFCTTTFTVEKATINGTLVYNNSDKTEMNKVTLELRDNGGTPIATDITADLTGAFEFTGLCAGTYTIHVTDNQKDLGGVNSTDAGAVNAWSATYGSDPIEHVKFLSGDVTKAPAEGETDMPDKFLSSDDALKIQRKFVFHEDFAEATPDWVYWIAGEIINHNASPYATEAEWPTEITVVVNGNIPDLKLYGQATGDFNGSLVPTLLKSASPSLTLEQNSSLQMDANQEFELPLRASRSMEVSAVSMILELPSNLVKVQDVMINGSNEPAMWAVNGNELRIGWNSLSPVHVGENGSLVTLKLKTSNAFAFGQSLDISLPYNPLNELAGGNHKAMDNASLLVARVGNGTVGAFDIEANSGLAFSNYPNPFSKTTTLEYKLPVDGKVSLTVYNSLGQRVSAIVNENQQSGRYSVRYDGGLQPGIYVAKLRLTNSDVDMVGTIKLSVTK